MLECQGQAGQASVPQQTLQWDAQLPNVLPPPSSHLSIRSRSCSTVAGLWEVLLPPGLPAENEKDNSPPAKASSTEPSSQVQALHRVLAFPAACPTCGA